MTCNSRRAVLSITACLTVAISTVTFARKDNDDAKAEKERRPALALRIDRRVGIAPMRVMLTADLIGGADDYQDFYCPAIEWDWGDGTRSAKSFDCEPYERHISKIVRHFSVEHRFDEGDYCVTFRLKSDEKQLASADARLTVSWCTNGGFSHESATAPAAAHEFLGHDSAGTPRAGAGLVLLTKRTRGPPLHVSANGL